MVLDHADGSPVVVPLMHGRQTAVTPGVLDENAQDTFTHGQCHALAKAIHQRTGWPIAIIATATCTQDYDVCEQDRYTSTCPCQFQHTVTVLPDGRLLDITGVFDWDPLAFQAEFGEPVILLTDPADIECVLDGIIDAGGLRPPLIDLALRFADTLLTREHLTPAQGH